MAPELEHEAKQTPMLSMAVPMTNMCEHQPSTLLKLPIHLPIPNDLLLAGFVIRLPARSGGSSVMCPARHTSNGGAFKGFRHPFTIHKIIGSLTSSGSLNDGDAEGHREAEFPWIDTSSD
jgi:hypothetical protein